MYRRIITYTLTLFLLCSTQIAYSDHTHVTSVVGTIMPAVVDVVSERYDSLNQPEKINPQGFIPRNPRSKENVDTDPTKGGSGFVISADGYVITNAHVIMNIINNKGITHLTFENGEQYDAELINYDKDSDIALLKIKQEDGFHTQFPFAVWGETPEVGEKAIAMGSPMNLSFTTTFGNISALSRYVPSAPSFVPFIQTDAPINPGNSGGPLFNIDGKLIGINTMIVTGKEGVGSVGLGFAIDGDYAQSIIERLKTGEKIKRPLVGIMYRSVTRKDMKQYKAGYGAYINEVIPTGPSANILKAGDIILKINDNEVKWKMLATIIAMKEPNTDVVFTVLRDNEVIDITVTLGEK
jgi:serine protease Do